MEIRKLKETDFKEIDGLVKDEKNFTDPQYRKLESHVLDDDGIKGFFTIKEEWGFPSLQHFYVGREFRSFARGRALIKGFVDVVKKKGYSKAILHASDCMPQIKRFIKYYFKVSPYARKGERNWYLVNLGG